MKCVFGLFLLLCFLAYPQEPLQKTVVNIALKDGSTLKGFSTYNLLNLKTAYADCQVKPSWIRSMTFNEEKKTASLILKNGDKLTGHLDIQSIKMETLFGPADVAFKHIKKLRFVDKKSAMDGLQLYFRFDLDENNVYDFSPNEYNGVAKSIKFVEDGKIGGAAKFDGTSLIDAGRSKLKLYDQISMAIWIKLDKLPEGKEDYSTIVARYPQFILRINKEGQISSRLYGPTPSDDLRSQSKVPLNKWTHIAFTFNDDRMTLYINGERDSQVTTSGLIRNDGGRYSIGLGRMVFKSSKGEYSPYIGLMDELMIFNRALSADEIKQTMAK